MNRIEQLFVQNPSPEIFSRGYLSYVSDVLAKIDVKQIASFISALEEGRQRGARFYFLGNGGSAATASHFVNDLTVGTRLKTKPFRAFSLSDNIPSITALANDTSYEDIFLTQLKAHLTPQDVVIAISASGNSPNLLKAIDFANQLSVLTIGLTGFDGGKLAQAAKLNVHVPSQKGEYGPVEDAHMALDHLVHAYFAQKGRMET